MRAGILTFHKADNYGAVLQAYALSQQLYKLGVENDFVKISFDSESTNSTVAEDSKNPFIKKVKSEKYKRTLLFEEFRRNHMSNSFEFSIQDIEELNDKYDFFIAGSDQIWNFAIPDTDLSFFLPFAKPEKRFSYAASFGNQEIPKVYYDTCRKLLSQFSLLSVREEAGAKQLFDITGRSAIISPDPTLILDREDWDKITYPVKGERYVLLFLLTYDEKAVVLAKQIAESEHLTIKTVSAGYMPQFGFHAWSGYGVEDWISLIKDAEFVVTNSFHGTVFSIIFHKFFCVMPLTGNLAKRNGRMTELLQKVSLGDCYGTISKEIDYDKVASYMSAFQRDGISYLKDIIKMCR